MNDEELDQHVISKIPKHQELLISRLLLCKKNLMDNRSKFGREFDITLKMIGKFVQELVNFNLPDHIIKLKLMYIVEHIAKLSNDWQHSGTKLRKFAMSMIREIEKASDIVFDAQNVLIDLSLLEKELYIYYQQRLIVENDIISEIESAISHFELYLDSTENLDPKYQSQVLEEQSLKLEHLSRKWKGIGKQVNKLSRQLSFEYEEKYNHIH